VCAIGHVSLSFVDGDLGASVLRSRGSPRGRCSKARAGSLLAIDVVSLTRAFLVPYARRVMAWFTLAWSNRVTKGKSKAGAIDLKAIPRLVVGADPVGKNLTPIDFFLMSRVDGRADVHTLGQLVGQPDARVLEGVAKLAQAGLIEIPGYVPPTPEPPAPTPPKEEAKPEMAIPEGVLGHGLIRDSWPVPFAHFAFDPVEMTEGTAMSHEQKQVVLYYHYHLRRVTYYDLFGIPQDADRDLIKKVYFRLSKAFHPDRWFRKDVGPVGDKLEEVFKWVSRAYTVLSSVRKRRGYDRLLEKGYLGEWQIEERERSAASPDVSSAEEPQVAMSSLLLRARRAETKGQWSEVAELYGRAVRTMLTTELRIRLIECMLCASVDLAHTDREVRAARTADPRERRLLILEAEVARRLGDVRRAVDCYQHVLQMDPSNPVAKMGLERLRGAQ